MYSLYSTECVGISMVNVMIKHKRSGGVESPLEEETESKIALRVKNT